jgi:hypothetical protein
MIAPFKDWTADGFCGWGARASALHIALTRQKAFRKGRTALGACRLHRPDEKQHKEKTQRGAHHQNQ